MEKQNWIEIQKQFDNINNVNEIFYFLRNLIDEQQICENAECSIFPDLHKLDLSRYKFRKLQIFTLKEAKSEIKNKTELKKFEDDYDHYICQSKSVFSRCFALKTSLDLKLEAARLRHERKMEMVREFNKSKIPVHADFQLETQEYIDELDENEKVRKEAKEKMKQQAK